MRKRALRRALLGLAFAAAALSAAPAVAQDEPRVEVVEVDGLIDRGVESAVRTTLDQAKRNGAAVVVVQIDSAGSLTVGRARRMTRLLLDADVPVVTWVGPSGAEARNAAAVLALSGHIRAMAPGTVVGPVDYLDLKSHQPTDPTNTSLMREVAAARDLPDEAFAAVLESRTAEQAADAKIIDLTTSQLPDLLDEIDGREVEVSGTQTTLEVDPNDARVFFRKPGLWHRMLHATAQPSITYLLLLLGLVGIVFELFHPSNGPAGISGIFALALAAYGVAALGGSWFAVALIVGGVAAFCVDLRVQGLGVFTLGGFAALVAGSILLFRAPWLRASPWVLALGVASMTAFLIGAMTRVLRDLRAIRRGELVPQDPHPHPEPDHMSDQEAT